MPELVIGDHNWRQHVVTDPRYLHLCSTRPRQSRPGELTGVPLLDPAILIPQSEWDDRIAQNDKDKAWLRNITDGVVPCLDQNGLGYCWAYGTTTAIMSMRVKQGHQFVLLAPESLGGSVGWKNKGNYVDSALKEARDKGVCAQAFLDAPHSLKPDAWKEGWQTDAANHKIIEWFDLDVKDIAAAISTCCLLGIPFAAGFSWWGHLVCGGFGMRRKAPGQYEWEYRNSWGADYGENGFFWMTGRKGIPDIGAFAPRHVTVSRN